MALSPEHLRVMPVPKLRVMLMLIRMINEFLIKQGSHHQSCIFVLPRGNYDAQILDNVRDIYLVLGWTSVDIVNRDGSLEFTLTPPRKEHPQCSSPGPSVGHVS